MICPNCSQEVPANAKVCGYCGTRLFAPPPPAAADIPAAASVPPTYPAAQAPAPKKGLPTWLLVAGGGMLMLILLLALLLFSNQDTKTPDLPPVEEAQSPMNEPQAPGFEPQPQQQPAAQSAASVPQAAQALDALNGTWSGKAENPGANFIFTMTFNLSDCQLNLVCGRSNIPELGCESDITFYDVQQDKFYFKESNLTAGCSGIPSEQWLRVIDANSLEYVTRGNYGEARGILTRQ